MGTKVGYVRVSTRDQTGAGQVEALKKAGVEKIVVETISRGKAKPVRNKLLRELREGDELYVYALDRIAGTTVEWIKVLEFARTKKVRLVCLQHDFDTEGPSGRMLMNMLAVFAQFERELLVERTKSGLRAAKAAGQRLGRPRKWKEEHEKFVATSNKSAAEIAELLSVSRRTVVRIREHIRRKKAC